MAQRASRAFPDLPRPQAALRWIGANHFHQRAFPATPAGAAEGSGGQGRGGVAGLRAAPGPRTARRGGRSTASSPRRAAAGDGTIAPASGTCDDRQLTALSGQTGRGVAPPAGTRCCEATGTSRARAARIASAVGQGARARHRGGLRPLAHPEEPATGCGGFLVGWTLRESAGSVCCGSAAFPSGSNCPLATNATPPTWP